MHVNKILGSFGIGLLSTAVVLLAETPSVPSSAESSSPTLLPKFVMVEKGDSDRSLTAPSFAKTAEAENGIPGGLTLLSTERMNKGRASNFQDLLQGAPGVFLQSESESEVTKISIRGSGILSEDEPLGVQFLLDGLSLNQADGEAILEDIDLATIKYAEIYRGADALVYGGLTLGGAINLVSATGYDAAPFKVQVEAGSYGYLRGQATAAGVAGHFDYIGSWMTRSRDGFREHSREKLDRLSLNGGYRLSETSENRVYITLNRASRALPGGLTKEEMILAPRQAADEAIEQDFNKKFDLIRVADKIVWAVDQHKFEAGVFWFHRNLEERDFFSPDFRQGITDLHSNNYGAVLNSVITDDLFGHRNRLSIGLNATLERERTENFENLAGQRGATTAHSTDRSLNTPIHLENLYYFTPTLSLLTGAQWIYARREFSDLFLADDEGDQSHTQTFTGMNPKLGLAYSPSATNKMFFNLSRSWQPPSFNNMVQFGEGPNSSVVYKPLRPQHAWTMELGTRGTQGPWEWEISVYQSRVEDELLELNDAQGHDRGAVNVPHSRHRGVEAGLDVELLELFGFVSPGRGEKNRLTLRQSYTFNDFHFRNDPVYNNNRIAGIPPHFYQAELFYEAASGFYIGPNLQYVPSHYAVDQENRLFADPYALLGLKIGFARPKGPSVFLEVKNFLNRRYASSVDPVAAAEPGDEPEIFHPGEGRAIYGGVSWTW